MNLATHLKNNFMEVDEALSNSITEDTDKLQGFIMASILEKRRIFIAGNGGSAADAQHFAAELVARFEREREPVSAEALSTDTSVITAIANDYSFEEIFSRQLEAKANADDLFIGISTSGNSKNIVKALEFCKKHKIKTVLFTGKKPSKGSALADFTFHVDSDRVSVIQTVHQVVYHSICEFIEQEVL